MAKPQYSTAEHRALRNHYRTLIDSGNGWCAEMVCLMTTRYIEPGAPFDAAHDRTSGGYLGPAHPRCNRAEGGRHRHATPPGARRWEL